jgi:cytochrome c-type biogenesis protein CcmF
MPYISIIENLLLTIGLISSLIGIVKILARLIRDESLTNSSYFDQSLVNISFFSVCLLFFLILYSFLSLDFSLKLVSDSVSSILPLQYRIGAVWTSQSGSILLWLFITSIIGFITIKIKSLRHLIDHISIFYLFHIASIIIILFFINPFARKNTEYDILGLNPSLQDIALTIHPPILYIGYALGFGIFIFTVINIIYQNKYQVLQKISYNFSKLCFFFISMGTFLGAWWAYRELGWGGYWFFDPVENISLMPLFCVTAYYHSMMVQSKDIRFVNISNFFGISIFITTIIGTTFTRSGLLTSVHSFINENLVGYYLVGFAFVFTSFFYTLLYFKRFKESPNFLYEFNKKSAIQLTNYLWILSTLIIILSLIFPILTNIVFSKIITIESEFFISTLIPLLLLTILVMGVFSYINKPSLISYLVKFLLAFIFSIYIKIRFNLGILNFFGFLVSFYIIVEIIISFIIALKDNKFEKKMAMIISHFGIGLLCLSISANKSFEKEFDLIGNVGSKSENEVFESTILSMNYSKGTNYIRQIVDIELKNKSSKGITILSPERRLYIVEKTLSSESNIMSFLFTDIYAVISNVEANTIYIKLYYKPFISIIWIACILISLGIFISILSKTRRFAPQ